MTTLIKKEFLENLLRKNYNDSKIYINNFEMEEAGGKGDNFISLIFRVDIDWHGAQKEEREEQLIIKIIMENSLLKDTIISFFKTENIFYSQILSIYEEIYKKRICEKRFPKLTPKFYECDQNNLVVLKDLTHSGFRLCNRQKGADFNHGVLVMRTLAQLHALSIASIRKSTAFETMLPEPFYTEKNEQLIYMFFVKAMKEVIESIEEIPEFKKYIGRIQLKCAQDIIGYIRTGKLKVLCHGDCWINNMLFRYDEDTGVPEEIRMIDFQLSYFGSLACDLIYFFYTSMRPEILSSKKPELIEIYICELHKCLNELGEDIREFTRENIYNDLEELQYFGVVLVCSLLGMMLAKPDDALSLDKNEDFDTISSDLKQSRNNPIYNKKLLKHFENFARDNII